MGCLSLTASGDVEVGPFAQFPLFETPDNALGPFSSLKEFCTAAIKLQMAMLATGEVDAFRVDNYLSFLWRLEHLDQPVESTSDNGPFYVKHYDNKGDHILIDEDDDGNLTITGIVGWECASFEAKPLAFSSPFMLWPVEDFYNGKNNLAPYELRFAELFAERGHDDLAGLARGGRKWQRFLFFLGGGIPSDKDEFEALFRGLQEVFVEVGSNANAESYGGAVKIVPFAEWKAGAMDRLTRDDPQFAALVAEGEGAVETPQRSKQ